MTTLARGQASTPRTPYLATFVLDAFYSLAYQPEMLSFAIYDRTTDGAPVQVYPADPLLRAAVDTRLAPLGDCISPGRYAARWTVPLDATVGRYEIRWWHQQFLGDLEEYTYAEAFEVVEATRVLGPAYAMVADLREQGVCGIDDATLHQKIVRASRMFEQYTGRTFQPAYKTVRADGRGTGVLALGEPIVAIEYAMLNGARYLLHPVHGGYYGSFRIYNRHLSEQLTDPDDRENPRIDVGGISSFSLSSLTAGRQNVHVSGVFGYTDPVPFDGPPAGVTPELVSQAVRLLAMRDLPRLTDVADREDAQKRWKLTSESTRDQSYGFLGGVDASTRGAVVGATTGDPEIDNIIILYRRGAHLGAA